MKKLTQAIRVSMITFDFEQTMLVRRLITPGAFPCNHLIAEIIEIIVNHKFSSNVYVFTT